MLEKKNNGETAANSQQNNSIFIHKESVDQPVYKNSPIAAIKEFREYENEADIRGFTLKKYLFYRFF